MKPSQIGLIFDGDDTLWQTQALYERAKDSFLKVMVAEGFDGLEARQQFDNIEIQNARLLGFSRVRFPKSMSDTYKMLCKHVSRPAEESLELLVENIGKSVFEGSPKIFEGVHEVLMKLRSLNVLLILATKGDEEAQQSKIAASSLKDYFHRAYIFENKGTNELMEIVRNEGIDRRESWSIGNSIRSDINPAIRIGMKAIWIPTPTWDFEEQQPIKTNRLFRADSVKEVPGIVMKTLGVEA